MPPIALDAIAVSAVGSREVVNAVVATATGTGGENLNVGAAIVGESRDDAAVKAVLSALNRRVANLAE